MGIRLVDVSAPLTVVAVDLIIESTKPEWAKWATYGMTAIGYGLPFFSNIGGDYTKNIGIAALPAAARNIYEQVRGMSSPVRSRRLGLSRVSRYPAPLVEQPFGGTRLV